MKRLKVKSGNLAEVGYDMPTLTLEVKFHNGSIYKYWPIGRYTYDALMGAKSIGSYFAREIKGKTGINFQRTDEL